LTGPKLLTLQGSNIVFSIGGVGEVGRFTTTSGNLLIGGTTDISGSGGLKVFGTTDANSTISGALQVLGGVGVAKSAWFGGTVYAGSGTSKAYIASDGSNVGYLGTTTGAFPVEIRPNQTTVARFTTTGNLLVGTTTDMSGSGGLTVTGTAVASNFLLGTGGPSVSSTLNARASRQGLLFDGTGQLTTFTSTAIGATGFTVSAVVNATTLGSSGRVIINGSSFEFGVLQTGVVYVYNGATALSSTGTVTAGKLTSVAYTKSGSTGTFYINGVAAGTVTDALTYGSAIGVGGTNATSGMLGAILAPVLYNRALSAAEVLSLYEAGAPAQADYPAQFAGTALLTGNNSNFATGVGTWQQVNGAAIAASGGVLNVTGSSAYIGAGTENGLVRLGARYRLTFTSASYTGTVANVMVFLQNGDTFGAYPAGTHTVEFTATVTSYVGFSATGGTSGTFTLDNVTLVPLGVTLAPDANQPGGGLAWYDTSGNNATITLPASGVNWNVRTSGKIAQNFTVGNSAVAADYTVMAESGAGGAPRLRLLQNGIRGWNIINRASTGTLAFDDGSADWLHITTSGLATFAGQGRFSAQLAVGTAPDTAVGFNNRPTIISGSFQYGLYSAPTINASTADSGFFSMLTAASSAVGSAFMLRAFTPTLGASSTITNAFGLRIENIGATGVTNAWGIDIANQSGGSGTNIGLRNAGLTRLTNTTNSTDKITGSLVIGDGTNGGLGVSGAINSGGSIATVSSSTSTNSLIRSAVPGTAAANAIFSAYLTGKIEWQFGGVASDSSFRISSNNLGTSDVLTISSGGNTTFAGTLTTNNAIKINAAATGGNTYLQLQNNGSSIGLLGSRFAIDGGSAADVGLYVYGANNLTLWTNSTVVATFASSGATTLAGSLTVNGSGTSGFNGPLTITTAAGNSYLRILAPAGQSPNVQFYKAGAAQMAFGYDLTGTVGLMQLYDDIGALVRFSVARATGNTTIGGTLTVAGSANSLITGSLDVGSAIVDSDRIVNIIGAGSARNYGLRLSGSDVLIRNTSNSTTTLTSIGGLTLSSSATTLSGTLTVNGTGTSTIQGDLVVPGQGKAINAQGYFLFKGAYCNIFSRGTSGGWGTGLVFHSSNTNPSASIVHDPTSGDLTLYTNATASNYASTDRALLINTSQQVQVLSSSSSNNSSSGALVVTGGVGVGGVVSPAGGVRGTATNDNAAAGIVGEFASVDVAYASRVALTSGTAANAVSLSLTAGDWDVQFNPVFTQITGGTVLGLLSGVSSTSATLPSSAGERGHSPSGPNGNSDFSLGAPRRRISLSATTTIYGVVTANFSSGAFSVYGFMSARRVR
jgi:hypothetical protein